MSTETPDIEVSYRCTHISCRNPKCHKGFLSLSMQVYQNLFDIEPEPSIIRSPTGHCKLGTPQRFEILDIKKKSQLNFSPKEKVLDLEKEKADLQGKLNKLRADYEKKQEKLRREISKIEAQLYAQNALVKQNNTSK